MNIRIFFSGLWAGREDEDSMYLLERKGKFLDERYRWTKMPHAFPEWQFGAVLEMAMQFKDRPKRVGEVVNGTVVFTVIP